MDHEAKFTGVKQARLVKLEVARSWIYVTTLSMSMLWSAARVDRKENRIFRFLNIRNKIAFYPNRKFFFADVHCMKCRIRWENKNFWWYGHFKFPKKDTLSSDYIFSLKNLISLYLIKSLDVVRNTKKDWQHWPKLSVTCMLSCASVKENCYKNNRSKWNSPFLSRDNFTVSSSSCVLFLPALTLARQV